MWLFKYVLCKEQPIFAPPTPVLVPVDSYQPTLRSDVVAKRVSGSRLFSIDPTTGLNNLLFGRVAKAKWLPQVREHRTR